MNNNIIDFEEKRIDQETEALRNFLTGRATAKDMSKLKTAKERADRFYEQVNSETFEG